MSTTQTVLPPATPRQLRIPTIDISVFRHDPNSAEAAALLPTVEEACKTTGFFLIKGHGVSRDLQQSVFKAAASFFKLPFDQKLALDAKKNTGMRGYDVLASQSYSADVM